MEVIDSRMATKTPELMLDTHVMEGMVATEAIIINNDS